MSKADRYYRRHQYHSLRDYLRKQQKRWKEQRKPMPKPSKEGGDE